LDISNTYVVGCNMPRWSHSKKQVRKALDEADRTRDENGKARFDVEDTNASGHGWGYILYLKCRQRFPVWSTPKNADNHAEQIRRFLRRHHHEEED
jgi:hypothetical protein